MKFTNDRFIIKRQEKNIDKILLEYKNEFNPKKLNKRYISNSPYQVLDAPELNICKQNFIIDFSNATNNLVIVLDRYIYIWNQKIIDSFCPIYLNKNDYTISVKFNKSGKLLAHANNFEIMIYDLNLEKNIVYFKLEYNITNISWKCDNILSTGTFDSSIYTYDIGKENKLLNVIKDLKSSITYVYWCNSGRKLAIYSSKNLSITNFKKTLFKYNKGIDLFKWNPNNNNIFAISIKNEIEIWNIENKLLNKINIESNITNICWNIYMKELIIGTISNNIYFINMKSLYITNNIKSSASILDIFIINDKGLMGCLCSNEVINLFKIFEKKNKKQTTCKYMIR